jgi:type III secretion protein J
VEVDAVQKVVAGGVGGLAPADVTVVTVARTRPPARGELALAHVGPLAVAKGSVRSLELVLITLAGVIALLAAVTVFLMSRIRKLRSMVARPAKSG